MTQQFALVLIACLTITSCTSTKGATEAEFSFTFQSDAEGWIAGFADLPANFEPSIYELDSGYRPLPQGLEGNGLYIQGHNRSDDLFMFFKRRIDGLKADATYAVFASLDLATNVPSNTFGIGGSPGESVYVKAGVSTVEPVAEGENLRLNIDKGNQSNDGASMVVIGNVAHPEVVGREFRLKSLDNADNPVNVTTDSKGGLKGYEASLEVGKVYRIIPDDEASVHGYIRIIDESGENYAFGDHRFHRVDLPDAVGEILASAQQE